MKTLAFLAHPDSLGLVPADARVLPLSPHVAIPADRQIAQRPEALLNPEDFQRIEREARAIAGEWWKGANRGFLAWQSVDLGECFENEFQFVARDLLKGALVLEKALDHESPEALFVDVPPAMGKFPVYPYLFGMGSLLKAKAEIANLPLHSVTTPARPSRAGRRSTLARAYSAMTARQAFARLRAERPLVAVGPFPESYGPVARAWSQHDGATVVVGSSRAPLRADPAAGLYFTPFEAFLTAQDRREIRAFTTEALASLAMPGDPATRLRGWELAGPLFLEQVRLRLRDELFDLACQGTAFDRGLERAVHVLLMETHTPMAKAALRYARRKGLAASVLQHGVLADPESYRQTETQRIAAWGVSDAEWFQRNLPPPVRAEATGNPRYDFLARRAGTQDHPALHDVPDETPVILFASAPFGHLRASESPWERDRLQNMVLKAARGIEGALLVLKRHPSEAPEPLLSRAARDPNDVREVRGGDTFALIRRSAAVLSMGSTVALEAMYLDRPAVLLGEPNPQSPFQPPEEGGGLRAHTAEDLANQVRRLLHDTAFRERVLDGQRAYLRRAYAPLDGRASERVATFLRRT